MESRWVYRLVEYEGRFCREPLDTPHSTLTKKLAIGVADTADVLNVRSTLALANTIWASAAKDDATRNTANQSIRSFLSSFPFEKQKEQPQQEYVHNDEEEGRKLMEKYIKYRDMIEGNTGE